MVVFGTHSAIRVSRKDQNDIRTFYRDVLDCKITEETDEMDIFLMGDNFYIAFVYGDTPDESEFLRTGKSIWLELKSDNVEELGKKILNFGVRKLDLPGPHLYFQSPGGQVFRLVGVNEDLSKYEGKGAAAAPSRQFWNDPKRVHDLIDPHSTSPQMGGAPA